MGSVGSMEPIDFDKGVLEPINFVKHIMIVIWYQICFDILIIGGNMEFTSEHPDFGGLRVTTFMIYMSHVDAGGHTVFAQAGVSVQPVEGKALFWFNVGSHGTYDSR